MTEVIPKFMPFFYYQDLLSKYDYINQWKNKIIQGNIFEVIDTFPDEFFFSTVYSPPYWNCRSYETIPIVLGGNKNCDHIWIQFTRKGVSGGVSNKTMLKRKGVDNFQIVADAKQGICMKCGGVKCEFGREPFVLNHTFEFEEGNPVYVQGYVSHLADLADKIMQKTRKDGSQWINISDTYSTQGGQNTKDTEKYTDYASIKLTNRMIGTQLLKSDEFPNKTLCLIPERVAISLVDDYHYMVRNMIIWKKCLDEDTNLFVKFNGKYQLITIKELYIKFRITDNVLIPTQNKDGKFIWVRIYNVRNNGVRDCVHITLNGGKDIICTEDHKFVYKNSTLLSSTPETFRKIKIKQANELELKDYLFVNTKLYLKLPIGTENDYLDGFIIGFYIAEGCYIINKLQPYKKSVFSKYAQRHWGTTEREDKKIGIEFSCGITDIERGYIDKLKKYNIKIYQYGNCVHIRSYDKLLLDLIEKYTEGNLCNTKHLKTETFNQTLKLLEGIIDGFLAGDGHYEKSNERCIVGIKPNDKLINQIECICRIFGYDFRKQNQNKIYLEVTDKFYDVQKFTIRKIDGLYRTTKFNLQTNKIRSIEKIGQRNVYDIAVQSIYYGRETNSISIDPKRIKYNNLYFIGNGIWTHNCNAMPSSIKNKFTSNYEFWLFVVKNNKPLYWVNESSMEIVSKHPKGINGEEGYDWEWKLCEDCITKIEKKPDLMESYLKPEKKKFYFITDIETFMNAIPNLSKESLKTLEFSSVCGKKGCECGKVQRSLWRMYDYYFEQQFEELKHPDKKGKNQFGGKKLSQNQQFTTNSQYSGKSYNALDHLYGKNMRSVWEINVRPTKYAHFASYSEDLVHIPIDASVPKFFCTKCGLPRVKIYDFQKTDPLEIYSGSAQKEYQNAMAQNPSQAKRRILESMRKIRILKGFSHCQCKEPNYIPAFVFAPFGGTSTTEKEAINQHVNFIGVEIKPEYVKIAKDRLKDAMKNKTIDDFYNVIK